MAIWVKKWKVQSDSNRKREYTVSIGLNNEWGCSCTGWINHHKDCKHIRRVRKAQDLDEGLVSIIKLAAYRVELLRAEGKTDEEISEILQRNLEKVNSKCKTNESV